MNTIKFTLSTLFSTLVLVGLLFVLPHTAYADCNPDPGTTANDNIVCDSNDNNGIDATQGGNDSITIIAGGNVSNNDANAINTGNGNDVVTIEATGTVSTQGASANGFEDDGGNDSYTIAGTISTQGDFSEAIKDFGGNDTYIISGNATTNGSGSEFIEDVGGDDSYVVSGNISTLGTNSDVIQDNAGNNTLIISGNIAAQNQDAIELLGNGNNSVVVSGRVAADSGFADGIDDIGSGDSTFIVSGSIRATGNLGDGIEVSDGNNSIQVSGSIISDQGSAIKSVGNGNDTVRLTGTTLAGGNGTAIQTGNSDDHVIIEGNADITGIIDGGADNDTLTFAQEVAPEELAELTAAILAANPDGDTITINGKVYTWQNFEGLVALLREIAPELIPFIDATTETCTQGGATIFRNPAAGWEVYYNGDHIATFSFEQAASPPVTLTNALTGWSARLETDNSISILDANGSFVNGSCGYLN